MRARLASDILSVKLTVSAETVLAKNPLALPAVVGSRLEQR